MIKCNMIKISTPREYDKMLYDKLFDFFYHIYFFNMIKKKTYASYPRAYEVKVKVK